MYNSKLLGIAVLPMGYVLIMIFGVLFALPFGQVKSRRRKAYLQYLQ